VIEDTSFWPFSSFPICTRRQLKLQYSQLIFIPTVVSQLQKKKKEDACDYYILLFRILSLSIPY
jgi:hypothetical protein